jgi:GT2 family glycosyltransferase
MTRQVTSEARVAVVVLNYNGLEDTVKCLISLRNLSGCVAPVIVVDNKSTLDPGAAAAHHYPGVVLVHNDDNLGYAGGNNRGIDLALDSGADYVLVLNNDTTVSPLLVKRLTEAFHADPSLGIVGPIINYMDEPDRVMTDGTRFNRGPGEEFFARVEVPIRANGDPAIVDIVNGCCMMLSARMLRHIGAFDERLFIVHEESDLCLRAAGAGYRCGVVPQTLVWHKGSSSFTRVGRQWQRYYDTRNLLFLLTRHRKRSVSSHAYVASLRRYLRYAYHRHEIECEAGQWAAARGVVDGLADALMRRTGPYSNRWRPIAPLVRLSFSMARLISRTKRVRGAPAARGGRPA